MQLRCIEREHKFITVLTSAISCSGAVNGEYFCQNCRFCRYREDITLNRVLIPLARFAVVTYLPTGLSSACLSLEKSIGTLNTWYFINVQKQRRTRRAADRFATLDSSIRVSIVLTGPQSVATKKQMKRCRVRNRFYPEPIRDTSAG